MKACSCAWIIAQEMPVRVPVMQQRDPECSQHGGYGAAERTTMRHCRCGWRMQSERSEVKP